MKVLKGNNCASCAMSVFIGEDDELACTIHRVSVGPGRNACKLFIEYRGTKQAKREIQSWKKRQSTSTGQQASTIPMNKKET